MAISRPKHHIRAVFYDGIPGTDDSLGFGHVEAWHKSDWSGSPKCIANEFLGAELARQVRLNSPPFGITYGEGVFFFTVLNFNFGLDAELPAIDPDRTWQQLPEDCTGVLLFDIFIANPDRTPKNLVVDEVAAPQELLVFDHDQAIFSSSGYRGTDTLDSLDTQLGISTNDSQPRMHCLMEVIDSAEHIEPWLHRIACISDQFIQDVCDEARSYGLSAAEAKQASTFLRQRKNRVEDIIKLNEAKLPKVEDWPWKSELF